MNKLYFFKNQRKYKKILLTMYIWFSIKINKKSYEAKEKREVLIVLLMSMYMSMDIKLINKGLFLKYN